VRPFHQVSCDTSLAYRKNISTFDVTEILHLAGSLRSTASLGSHATLWSPTCDTGAYTQAGVLHCNRCTVAHQLVTARERTCQGSNQALYTTCSPQGVARHRFTMGPGWLSSGSICWSTQQRGLAFDPDKRVTAHLSFL
jgi:hypothetical protein